jgi:hypothetical protein
MGAGGTAIIYLEIDNFYGRHRYTDGWDFDTNAGSQGWEILAEYFGYVVMAWRDSHC